MTANGTFQIIVFFVVILALTKPMGAFMTKVFAGERTQAYACAAQDDGGDDETQYRRVPPPRAANNRNNHADDDDDDNNMHDQMTAHILSASDPKRLAAASPMIPSRATSDDNDNDVG